MGGLFELEFLLMLGGVAARRLGLTRRIVTRRGALMRWLFVVYNLLGSATTSVACVGGGYLLCAALATAGVDIGQHVPALASSLGALAVLAWMRHHARVQRINQ